MLENYFQGITNMFWALILTIDNYILKCLSIDVKDICMCTPAQDQSNHLNRLVLAEKNAEYTFAHKTVVCKESTGFLPKSQQLCLQTNRFSPICETGKRLLLFRLCLSFFSSSLPFFDFQNTVLAGRNVNAVKQQKRTPKLCIVFAQNRLDGRTDKEGECLTYKCFLRVYRPLSSLVSRSRFKTRFLMQKGRGMHASSVKKRDYPL